MPPQLQQILQNQRLMIIIGSVLAALVIIGIVMMAMNSGQKAGEARRLSKEEQVLATVDTMGRALEIQALMARENINLIRQDVEGGKASLRFEENATIDDKDKALVTLVQSGLMDKNVGLEVFDKGDLTASREEKRIKLVRARNGELSRLIRKIQPIQDATVFISMPEPTIFKKDMEPISATVQVTLNPGEKLDRDKVRSIMNLLVGSIENLDASHIALSDTNGNVYNSVLGANAEAMDKLEERDRYMEQKIKTQLDRLVGPNKYSVTVSTYLREAPKSQMTLQYDPQESSVSKTSSFRESLSAQQKSGQAGGPVSTYLPPGLDTQNDGGDRSQRGYNRNGQEVEYNSGKRQISEDFMPGMLEEITIAVSIDSGAYPQSMTQEDLQTLIAHSASPVARPENVSVVVGKPKAIKAIGTPHVAGAAGGVEGVIATLKAIPWWIWALVAGMVFAVLLAVVRSLTQTGLEPALLEQQRQEIQQLRELAQNQAQQLQTTQQQTQEILQTQRDQIAKLSTQGTQEGAQALRETLAELKTTLAQERAEEGDDEELSQDIKSWIEST